MAGPPGEVTTVHEALVKLGRSQTTYPRHPVLHGPAGTLLSVGLFDGRRNLTWHGMWLTTGAVKPLGVPRAPVAAGLPEAYHLPEPTSHLVHLLAGALLSYLERIEEIDTHLSELEAAHPTVPIPQIATMQRPLAAVREQVGRLISLVAELGGPIGARFPDIAKVLPTLELETTRVESLSNSLQQSLRDHILMRNAEDSNRIAEAANELGKISNRIAALQNVSNIRMLGIAYLAFVIALIGAVVLIPNTGATILGMPSAAWVPGIWVDVILTVLAVVPIALVFSRGWVVRILRDFGGYERRSAEGIDDLPEVTPSGRSK